MFLILIAYVLALYLTGKLMISPWKKILSPIQYKLGSTLSGIALGVPVTYFLTFLLSDLREPMLWSVLVYILIAYFITFGFGFNWHIKNIKLYKSLRAPENLSDVFFIFFAFLISAWLMNKTLRGDVNGLLYVGSNTIFDFGNTIGLVRSMSWGHNFPITSPYEAGSPYFYHFFFYFFVAIWEYLGIPLHLAINMPSIISFSLMLMVIYYLPSLFTQKFNIAGILAVLLTLTHSTLTFWHLFLKSDGIPEFFRSLWNMQEYPYAGPYDGSVISIFMTLNNFMNQRHLAFAIAFGLFIYFLLVKSQQTKTLTVSNFFILGLFSGVLMLWNVSIWVVVNITLLATIALYRLWKQAGIFLLASSFASIVINLPNINLLQVISVFLMQRAVSVPDINEFTKPTWTLGMYLWENLGLLLILSPVSFLFFVKRSQYVVIPIFVLFTFLCLFAGYRQMGFDQKYLSFLIIGINVFVAVWLVKIWEKGKIIIKLFVFFAVFVLTVSGLVDLMPIKNEFAYPLISPERLPLMHWIHESTSKKAVFVSYADIIDPVVLSGRKNYFGFFGNVVSTDRSGEVRRIYGGDRNLALQKKITYIVVPHAKPDLPYTINETEMRQIYTIAYEDQWFTVFLVR